MASSTRKSRFSDTPSVANSVGPNLADMDAVQPSPGQLSNMQVKKMMEQAQRDILERKKQLNVSVKLKFFDFLK